MPSQTLGMRPPVNLLIGFLQRRRCGAAGSRGGVSTSTDPAMITRDAAELLRSKMRSSSSSISVFMRLDDREIAIDDVVRQRVQHERRAFLEQMRLALAAGAHILEAGARAAAHRQHIVAAHEHVDFADQQFARLRPFRRYASRRTATRRTPRFSDAGGRSARLRSRVRAGRILLSSRPARPAPGLSARPRRSTRAAPRSR